MALNKYIDHTLLKAIASEADIIKLCKEAIEHNFFSVCVNSCYVKLAKQQLKNSPVKVCSVIGFPLGAMSTKAKEAETQQAINDGADEIDMVINIGLLKSEKFNAVLEDLETIKKSIPNKTLKVILETCYLEDFEIINASKLAIQAGANYIKTSTGFGPEGATLKHVKLMRSVIKDSKTKIKASGGIRDLETAIKYSNLGVERIGTSSGVKIIEQLNNSM